MASRLGLGPVFACESTLSARRWQVYASRSGFVLMLLAGLSCIWVAHTPDSLPGAFTAVTAHPRLAATVGKGFFYALTGTQLSLILLAAPATAAGSLGMDRARGTLLQMFATDLSDVEIVLGTLAARLVPVVSLILCAVPVTALAALLGGIDFAALAGAVVVTLATAVLGCVLTLTVSVWVTKTHEVLMAVYMAESLWLVAAEFWSGLSAGPPAWFWKANPYVLVFSPYSQPGYAGLADFAAFCGGVLAISAALVILTITNLRRVAVAQAGRSKQTANRSAWRRLFASLLPSWPSPTLDGNPVLWREWHRTRPSALARAIETFLLMITWSLAAWGIGKVISQGVNVDSRELEVSLDFYLLFGFLMLSAAAPMALAEERARGGLEVLLATPLTSRQIVMAKWWGGYRRVLVMLPLFLFVPFFLAAAAPDRPVTGLIRNPFFPLTARDRALGAIYCPVDFLASGAFIVSLGVALSLWVRRLGKAVALSVILYFCFAVAWIPLIDLAFPVFVLPLLARVNAIVPIETDFWLQYLEALSPYGAILALNPFVGQYTTVWYWVGLGVVIAIKATAAGFLLWLTVRTFDRCVGRVSESQGARRRGKANDREQAESGVYLGSDGRISEPAVAQPL